MSTPPVDQMCERAQQILASHQISGQAGPHVIAELISPALADMHARLHQGTSEFISGPPTQPDVPILRWLTIDRKPQDHDTLE